MSTITLSGDLNPDLLARIIAMMSARGPIHIAGEITITDSSPVAAPLKVAAAVEVEVAAAAEVEADADDQVDTRVTRVATGSKPVDPPRKKQRRTINNPRGPVTDDELREACQQIDLAKPIRPQLQQLLDVPGGSVHALKTRAIDRGWLRIVEPPGITEPIGRRPFDPDAARLRSIGAI